MFPFRLYAVTGDAIAQIDSLEGERAKVGSPSSGARAGIPGSGGVPHGSEA